MIAAEPGVALHASGIEVDARNVASGPKAAVGGVTMGAVGVTAAEAAEAGPVPTALVAVTVNLYGVPLVNPGTLQARAPLVVHVRLAGELVAV